MLFQADASGTRASNESTGRFASGMHTSHLISPVMLGPLRSRAGEVLCDLPREEWATSNELLSSTCLRSPSLRTRSTDAGITTQFSLIYERVLPPEQVEQDRSIIFELTLSEVSGFWEDRPYSLEIESASKLNCIVSPVDFLSICCDAFVTFPIAHGREFFASC